MTADLAIVGGGFAGLAAAAWAAGAGARVVVAEKTGRLGGSAALSAGIVWTAPDYATLRRVVPGGDPDLGRLLVEGFSPAVDRIRATGVFVSERWEGQMGFGSAVRVDVGALIDRWRGQILAAGGEIRSRTAVQRLLVDDTGAVRGVSTGSTDIEARSVLLATGGFQGSTDLRERLLGPPARTMLVRSNPGSVGDGWRMATAVSAAASGALDAFYGHLVPSPLTGFTREHYLPLTQYYSNHCVLVNVHGRRFTDESLGDEVSNQAVLHQPGSRGLLLFDEDVRVRRAATAPYPHGQVVDRVQKAIETGARFTRARSLEELTDHASAWGFDAAGITATLATCERGDADDLGPPPAVPAQAPFYAMEVQPSITFPFGGLAVDSDGRVLRDDGTPIIGLFAAGADAGGLQDRRYVGGLVLGLVFGPRAAQAALH